MVAYPLNTLEIVLHVRKTGFELESGRYYELALGPLSHVCYNYIWGQLLMLLILGLSN